MALKQIANSLTAPDGSQYITLTDGAGNLVTVGGGSSLTVGTTTITGGTNGRILSDSSGVLAEVVPTGTGNVVLGTSPSITKPNIVGTILVDDALAGSVGEILSNSVAGSTTSVTFNTVQNLGPTITLTAGDWEVSASAQFQPAATTNITQFVASISATTGAFDNSLDRVVTQNYPAFVPGATTQSIPVGPTRFSVSANTQIWLTGRGLFSVSTVNAGGIIRARRVR